MEMSISKPVSDDEEDDIEEAVPEHKLTLVLRLLLTSVRDREARRCSPWGSKELNMN